MQIWPAIDLRGGKCVRLEQGDFARETVFGADPAAMATHWVAQGASQLHLVDLDGARDGTPRNRDSVAAILRAVRVPCQLGGGIRDTATIQEWLELGVARLVVGTQAWREPDWFRSVCRRYPGRLALGIDARGGKVATHGWLSTQDISAIDLARQFAGEPLAAVIYTDIETDGMLGGPNVQAVAELQQSLSLPVIASGGVTTVADVERLAALPVAGCIVGRALYEGQLSLPAAIQAAAAVVPVSRTARSSLPRGAPPG